MAKQPECLTLPISHLVDGSYRLSTSLHYTEENKISTQWNG